MSSASSPPSGGPARRLLPRGVALARRHGRRWFDALLLAQVLDALALVTVVHEVSVVTGTLLGGDGRASVTRALVAPGLLLVAALLVSGLCNAVQPALQTVLGERLAGETARDVLAVAGSLELADFDDPEVLDRLKRVEFGALVRPSQLAFGLGITLSGALGAVALAVGVLTIAPWLAAVAVAAAAPLWWAARRDGAHTYKTVRGLSRLERRRMYLAGLLTRREHAAEIRAFELTGTVLARYRALSAQRLTEVGRTARDRLVRQLLARAAGGALLLAGVGALLWLVATGRLTEAQAVAAAVAGCALRTRLADTASGVRQMQEAAEYVDDYARLLAEHPTGPPAPAVRERVTSVTLRGVGMSYPGMARPALRGVDLSLRPGELTVLVGANGSGKSTLATIAAGLLAPTEGEVLFNGVRRTAVTMPSWRGDIAVLRQDAGRYQESLRDNVAFGDPRRPADDPAVLAALRAAGGDALPDLLGGDLAAMVGAEQDGGVELSGGQWQRLALARVFYRDSTVMVLDEPSAPLDPLAERDLVQRLRASFADRIVLLVTHRMSAAARADQVLVLEGGTVVERGRPDELRRAGGVYARMCAAEDSLWAADLVASG